MFWAPCSSGEGAGGWGGVWGYLGAWGVSPHACTHTRTHAHAHTHMYGIAKATSKKASMFSMFNMHGRACVCVRMWVCVYVHGTSPHTPIPTPTPIHPSATPPGGVDPRNHLKFNNTSTYQDISILFEDLKSVKNSPPMGGCVVWWVIGWVDGWGQVKSLKI